IDEDAVFGQPGHPALERVTDVIRPYVESSGDADIYLAVPENLFLVIQEMLEAYPVNTAHMVYESMKRNTA
ncbi:MAG: hypothetical protein LJE56_00210, partial [Acidiferrobacterales bacterium]|nr:hypothetical protein [Acidiferrobacterales bacterium]